MCQTDSDTSTTDATSDCCGVCEQDTELEHGTGHWLDSVTLDQPLPDHLRLTLERFFNVESIETLDDWGTQIRQQTGGGTITVDQLCHSDDQTDHWGEVDSERYHFKCFYDAIILAAIEDSEVDIHTVSPNRVRIDAKAVGKETVSVKPETTVFSLGIALDAHDQFTGNSTMQDAYAAICPYVKAFPDRDAYEAWADEVPAATVAMSMSGAMDFARALTTEEEDD